MTKKKKKAKIIISFHPETTLHFAHKLKKTWQIKLQTRQKGKINNCDAEYFCLEMTIIKKIIANRNFNLSAKTFESIINAASSVTLTKALNLLAES